MATKQKKPVWEKEYRTASELAIRFNLSPQWIGKLVSAGVIKRHRTKDGMKYEVVEATRAYVSFLRKKAAGREEKGNPVAEKNKLDAEVRYKTAKAEVAELEAAEYKGQMHRSEDVEEMTTDLVFAIRSMLVALPGRIAVDVANAETSAEAAVIIKSEVHKILDELSRYRYDPKEYAKKVRERTKWADKNEEV